MNLRRFKFLPSAVAGAVALAISGSAFAQAKTVLRWGHYLPDSNFVQLEKDFAAKIEKRTGGAVKIDITFAEGLGKGTELLMLTARGGIDMTATAPGYNPDQLRYWRAFQTPLVFSDTKQVIEVLEKVVEEFPVYRAEMDKIGVVWLFQQPLGEYFLSGPSPSCTAIADLKGKKVLLTLAKSVLTVFWNRWVAEKGFKVEDFDQVYDPATPNRFAALQAGAEIENGLLLLNRLEGLGQRLEDFGNRLLDDGGGVESDVVAQAGRAAAQAEQQPRHQARGQLRHVEDHVGHVPGEAARALDAHEHLARLVVRHVGELDARRRQFRHRSQSGQPRLLLHARDRLHRGVQGGLRKAHLPGRQAQQIGRAHV